MDERALVEAVTGGDRDAFRRIVERESRGVFRTCFRILGRLDDADDVAQETFVIAYRSLDSYRGDGVLGAWLARIATRQAYRRLAQRSRVTSLDLAVHDRADGASATDPLRQALQEERQAEVRSAVAALPEPYRETVALRFFGELSLQEIADTTDRPLGTVKTHLRRGLERLRTVLGEEIAA